LQHETNSDKMSHCLQASYVVRNGQMFQSNTRRMRNSVTLLTT